MASRSTLSPRYDPGYQSLINKLAKTIFNKYEQKMIGWERKWTPPKSLPKKKVYRSVSQPLQPVEPAAAAMPEPENLEAILGQIADENEDLQNEFRDAEAEAPAAAAAAVAPAPRQSMYQRLKQAAIRAAVQMIRNNRRTPRSAEPAGIPMKPLTPKRGGWRRTIRGGRRHRRRNNKSCRRRR